MLLAMLKRNSALRESSFLSNRFAISRFTAAET